jgi:hypothetical protein
MNTKKSDLRTIHCNNLNTIQWVSEVEMGRSKGDHSSPSSAEGKNKWTRTFSSPYAFMACIGTTLLPHI